MTRTCVYQDPHMQERCTECGINLDLCTCANVNDHAHERHNTPDGQVFKMIEGELRGARAQFPGTTHMLAALTEEVGELAQALIDHDRAQEVSPAMVLREAVQVAAMAIRVATEGDENFLYVFPQEEEELPRGPVTDRF